jgi:hypothetical protein
MWRKLAGIVNSRLVRRNIELGNFQHLQCCLATIRADIDDGGAILVGAHEQTADTHDNFSLWPVRNAEEVAFQRRWFGAQ